MIVLIALVAALVAAAGAILPRLVDAEAIRARLVAETQAAIARPVAVRGSAELTFTPRPVLSVGRVTIGSSSAEGAAVLIEMDRLDLEVAPLSLLTGNLEVTGARIVRPRAHLRQHGRELAAVLAALPRGEGAPRSARLVDGQLRVEREGRPAEVLEQLEIELARTATNGLDLRGNGRWRNKPLSITLQLGGGIGGGNLPIDLDLDVGDDGEASSIELHGQVGLPAAGSPALAGLTGEIELEADDLADLLAIGAAAAGRAIPAASGLGPVAIAGKLAKTDATWRLNLSSAAIAGGEVVGHVEIDTAAPRVDIALDTTRLRPTDGLLATAAGLGSLPLPPGLTGSVRVQLAGLAWRNSALRNLRLTAELPGDDTLRVVRLAARLPDEGEIDIEGRLAGLSAARSWQGEVALSAQDLRALAGWLGLPDPALAPDRLRSLSGTAAIGWSGRQLSLRDMDLRLDATRITGSAALALESRPQLAAALTVDRLALDSYLPAARPPDLFQGLAGVVGEVDLALDIDLAAVSWQAIRAEGVKLRAQAEDRRLTLHELSVTGLAEATANLVGDADLTTGQLQLAVEADIPYPSRLARLAGYEPPALIGRLGAVRLTGTVRRDGEQLVVEGGTSSAGLTLDAEARLPIGLDGPPRLDRLTAETTDFAALVRQTGLPAAPALAGPARVGFSATPRGGGIVDLAASADLVGSGGEMRLRYDGQGERPKLSGSLGLGKLDAALMRLAWDTGELTLGFPPGPPSRWPGIWPRDALSWGWLYAADLDVSLSGTATGRLSLDAGHLELALDEATFAGGRLAGRLTLDGRDVLPQLSAEIDLSGANTAEAIGLAGLRGGLRGRLDLGVTLAGSGVDPAGIVGSLEGTARLSLTNGAIEGIRLQPVDVLDAAQPQVPVVALQGALTVDRGVATGQGLSLRLPDEEASLDVRLDLPAWMLEAAIRRPEPAPPLRMLGPPGRMQTLRPATPP